MNKIVHLDAKNITCFTQNLVQNLLSLVLASKSNGKWFKSSDNYIGLEKYLYTYFVV